MNKTRRLGQNFLQDEIIIQRIVDAIAPAADDHLVEIGPGRGAITGPLLASGCRLDVIELDRELARHLPKRLRRSGFGNGAGRGFEGVHDGGRGGERGSGLESGLGNGLEGGPGNGRLRIFQADALRFDYIALLDSGRGSGPSRPLRLAGNLPYTIATPLLFRFIELADWIEDMHFMLQLEVAERIAAAPGGKAWGVLGVMAQYHCAAELLFDAPPEAFAPPPKVRSAFVRLRPRREPGRTPEQAAKLRRLVAAAFAHRRKTLRNNLRDAPGMRHLPDVLEGMGIAPAARAETLSLEQFLQLSEHLAEAEN